MDYLSGLNLMTRIFFKQRTFSSGVSEIDTHEEEGKKVQEKGMSRR